MTALVEQLRQVGTGGMRCWYEAKMFIEHASVISSDALHVLVGTLVWLTSAIVLRKTLKSWLPWLVVFALTLLNEAIDLWVEHWPHPGEQYGETTKDVLLTIALPTLLLCAVRLQPKLFGPAPRR